MSDFCDARFSRDDILPSRGNPNADWGDNPQSSDDNSAFRQANSEKEDEPNEALEEGLLLVCQDVVDGLLNAGDFFRVFVRYFALKLFFESHH